jgi:hypothetical protein
MQFSKDASHASIQGAVEQIKQRLGFWSTESFHANAKLHETRAIAKKMESDCVYQLRMCTLAAEGDDDKTEHYASRVFYKNPLDALAAAIEVMLDEWFAHSDLKRMESLNALADIYLTERMDNMLTDVRALCLTMAKYIKKSSKGIGPSVYVTTLVPAQKKKEMEWQLTSTSKQT